jgi:glycosyltransferase involved in cell wall biosynthesis
MESSLARLGLVFDQDAYVEFPQDSPAAPAGASKILYGRRVAGKEFLEAILNYGTWSELIALTYRDSSTAALRQLWQAHPTIHTRSRRLHLVEERHFHEIFLPNPPATMLHLPCPPVARYAWARQYGAPGGFALSGVTHTLCALSDAHHLTDLVTAPFEPYDTLVCTSRAAVQQVRAVTGAYADYLRDRYGGSPGLRPRLELIPLGVDTEYYRPPTETERADWRRALKVADDEVVVLCVGRLSFHQKAHPFPMFQGLARAAQRTGRKIHLVLTGHTGNEAVHRAFLAGARTLAACVRISLVDSLQWGWRHGV